MDNGNLVKLTLNLTLANKLRNNPIQSPIYSSYVTLKVWRPLKKVHYDSPGFNLSNITSYDFNLHPDLLSSSNLSHNFVQDRGNISGSIHRIVVTMDFLN
ncbi:hypothetical protein ES703_89560 [subsurface metagenome]